MTLSISLKFVLVSGSVGSENWGRSKIQVMVLFVCALLDWCFVQ